VCGRGYRHTAGQDVVRACDSRVHHDLWLQRLREHARTKCGRSWPTLRVDGASIGGASTAFLEAGRALAVAKEGTVTWYAFRITESRFGIFDTFETEDARTAHLQGQIPAALGEVAPDVLATDPSIQTVGIVAVK
jgi:hypothetical protein